MLIDAGGCLSIFGSVNALDDVKIWADGGIFIVSAIAAVDDIEIRTFGDLTTTTDASLCADDDIEL